MKLLKMAMEDYSWFKIIDIFGLLLLVLIFPLLQQQIVLNTSPHQQSASSILPILLIMVAQQQALSQNNTFLKSLFQTHPTLLPFSKLEQKLDMPLLVEEIT